MRLALAQINTTVGAIDANAGKVSEWIGRARAEGADLVLFPELSLPGYPAEDLYLQQHFLEANQRALEELAAGVNGIEALVGYAEPRHPAETIEIEGPSPPRAYNALAHLAGGEVRATYRKIHLPNYGVFDERRYFHPGAEPLALEAAGEKVGLTICEDVWVAGDPEVAEVDSGARIVLNASASPYHRRKGNEREAMVSERARAVGAPIALRNLVGGQDELVFDGHSFVVNERGETVARAPQFEEDLLVCEMRAPQAPCPVAEMLGQPAEVYAALVLGLRDYVEKNGFERVILALSGGIDSALVALIASDALGAARVSCVVMPSPHSSEETQADARTIAGSLGCNLVEIPIEEAMSVYGNALEGTVDGAGGNVPDPDGHPDGGSETLMSENIQARIRGNLVMALSNRFGWLVLTTGNKSEMSVGYATLYGDMAGGFAVIKDVPKTLVYELVRHRNGLAGYEPVPASVLERAPSAELRPDQRDQDSLPPYELLDRILEAYVERDEGPQEMIANGLPADTVAQVIAMVDSAEYKRRQAPPGIKITPRAFGKDRRLPITNRFLPT